MKSTLLRPEGREDLYSFSITVRTPTFPEEPWNVRMDVEGETIRKFMSGDDGSDKAFQFHLLIAIRDLLEKSR